MYTSIDDTIVAISSAPGAGLRGIVRLSGPRAIEIADGLCRMADKRLLASASGFSVHTGEARVSSRHGAPVDIYVFCAPHSYTRQDLVELHTVGAPPLLDLIVERCLYAGARLALPGEFTARAFLGGAVTLPEAESVAATIAARSDDQLRSVRRMRDSHLADEIVRWQGELADLRALVEADIDFAEEPIDFISRDVLHERAERLHAHIGELLASACASERFDVLPQVLLLGLPNAGKSTLLNRLSGIDRAIASAVAGTTRDLLTAPARFGDVAAVVIDSAGIDAAADEIIAAGRARAVAAAQRAHLACVVVDASTRILQEHIADLIRGATCPVILVANKSDLLDAEARAARKKSLGGVASAGVFIVSALTGEGIADLQTAIAEHLSDAPHAADDTSLALSAHQRTALRDAAAALERCLETVRTARDVLDVAELVAIDLREAQDALAELTGAVTTEDLLGRIFSSFCIGK